MNYQVVKVHIKTKRVVEIALCSDEFWAKSISDMLNTKYLVSDYLFEVEDVEG